MRAWAFAAAVLLASLAWAQQQVKIVTDFEDSAELRAWDIKHKSGQIVSEHATHGKSAMKLAANEYLFYYRVPRDWSGYDAMEIDIFLDAKDPVHGSLLIADEAWQKKGGTYWNRHNGGFTLKPGPNTISIPVNGLYRGEAGSRNNDIKSNIDPTQIIRFDIGFDSKDPKAAVYMDYMRLVKETRPNGILAFDFGPASQTLFPGFTPISSNTLYGKNGNHAGLNYDRGSNSARDDTFPTRLYQDCVSMDDTVFSVDVPNGKYHVWLMFDDLGYWGGEEASFSRRWVESGGEMVWEENRGPSGPADYLYRFENVEPKPGDSMWDLYVKQLFTPKRFTVNVRDGVLRLKFRSDGNFACKVAALILYADSNKAQAEKWVADIEQRNKEEFDSRAVYLGKSKPLDIPPTAKTKGYWIGFPGLADTLTFDSPPGPSGQLTRKAAQGQRISLTFAIRPLEDLGDAHLSVTDLKSDKDVIPASEIDLRYVQHSTHRGFGTIAYTIIPERLRHLERAGLPLSKDLTRQFWITVHIPEGTPAGTYKGELSLLSNQRTPDANPLVVTGTVHLRKIPIAIDVLGFRPDDVDFDMAFYGFHVPPQVLAQRGDDATRELLRVIREAGMNTISGGPNIRFKGFDPSGQPILDYSAVDHYMQLLREAGFRRTLDGYGGPGLSGLHDGYVIGETGRAWEKKTGKPMAELLKLTWTAIRDHAQEQNWLPIRIGMADEPRVLDQVRPQLELARLYHDNAPWVNIGGSYSVNWKGTDAFDTTVQDLFKTFHWNAMNLHSQIDIDKAKQYGSSLYIYNQGRTRYSWGAYQWAEMHKGIKGRMQWHLLALHGYQFFDLDGREPDTAMINWGKNEIIPTLALVQAREGVDDFRFATTLWNIASKRKSSPEGREAVAWLEDISRQIHVNQNEAPQGFMSDEAFRDACLTRIEALRRIAVDPG